jgi:hypothetical protein
MSTTYQAILVGDRVQWLGDAPETKGGVRVRITVESPLVIVADEERRRRAIRETLESLAARGTYAAEIEDPVAWQREIRKDRPLPGRDE